MGYSGGRSYYPWQRWQSPPAPPVARGLFAPWQDNRTRREQDFFWGGRFN